MDKVKKKINESGFYKEKVFSLVEELFDGNGAKFLRKANLSHNYLGSMKKKKDPTPSIEAINKMINAAKKERRDFNPLWLIRDDEQMFLPEQPRRGKAAEPEEQYRSKFMQVGRLIASIEQKPDALKDTVLLGDLARECAQLTAKLLELQHKAQSEGGS